MARQILVPMDESEPARAALEFACEVHPTAEITVVYVSDAGDVDPGTYTSMTGSHSSELDAESDERTARAERVFADAREIASASGAEITTEAVVGDAVGAIVSIADDRDVDQVVIGSHGRSGASRVLLGSVAEGVARNLPIPVTIVQ